MVTKEVYNIKSVGKKMTKREQLSHCFLKAKNWNEAQVKPWSQAQHQQWEVSHHTVAVSAVDATICRLQGEAGGVHRS